MFAIHGVTNIILVYKRLKTRAINLVCIRVGVFDNRKLALFSPTWRGAEGRDRWWIFLALRHIRFIESVTRKDYLNTFLVDSLHDGIRIFLDESIEKVTSLWERKDESANIRKR